MATEGKKKRKDRPGPAQGKAKGEGARDESAPGGSTQRDSVRGQPRRGDRAPELGSPARGVLVPGEDLIGPGRAALVAGGEQQSLEGDQAGSPTELGARRYVFTAFFLAGILLAFLSGKILGAIWHTLADWPAVVSPFELGGQTVNLGRYLLYFNEEDRSTYAMVAGAIVAVIAVVQVYRKETIRRWADEVAVELSRVTWPTRETVTNGTVVVIVASLVATVYVALLDRFWGFLTQLIYST